MKPLPQLIINHIAEEVTTLTSCWKLTRGDGIVMGFTDHIADIKVDELVYLSSSGFNASSVENKSNFAVDNLEVVGMLSHDTISEIDIIAGKYDFAEVEVFKVNYRAPEQGIIFELKGWIGEVSIKNGSFIAEVRSLSQKLQTNLGSLYSPNCRATLGNKQCKLDLSNYTFKSKVIEVYNQQSFEVEAIKQESGYFTTGEVKWLSGANRGSRMEVKEYRDDVFTLALPMGATIELEDELEIIAGCNKAFSTCCNKFKNHINFRGEPYVPGLEQLLG